MKHKRKLEYLKQKQAWWERQSQSYKDSTTKPGSVKTR